MALTPEAGNTVALRQHNSLPEGRGYRYISDAKAAACAITSFLIAEGESRVAEGWSVRKSNPTATVSRGHAGHRTHPGSCARGRSSTGWTSQMPGVSSVEGLDVSTVSTYNGPDVRASWAVRASCVPLFPLVHQEVVSRSSGS